MSLFVCSLQKYSPAFLAFVRPVALSGFPNVFIWNSLHFYPPSRAWEATGPLDAGISA